MLNKQDTSIVTLALLLSIATSPIAWAASRWNSNTSVSASATLSESLLPSEGRTNYFNLNQQPLNQSEQRNFKPKAGETRKTKANQPESLMAQLHFGRNNLVSQSTQTQPSTLAASSGEIPFWLWWLVPVVPVLGLWLRLKLKEQAQKPETTLVKQTIQSDRNLSTLSPKPDDSQEKSQAATSNLIFTKETPLTPLTKPQFRNDLFKLGQDNVETEPEVILDQSLTLKSDLEEPVNPVTSIPTNTVQESILVEEIPEPEAEAVIAEFLNAKKASLNQSNVESLISESSAKEEESVVIAEVTEPDVIISEPEIVEEEEPLTVEEEEPVVVSEVTEPDVIITEPEIVEEEESLPGITIAETFPEPELGIPHQDIKNEADVVGMKFNIGGERKFEPALADVDEGLPNLPDGYGNSKIVLLPRDPNWVYAYWDVPNEHKERIRQQGGRYLLLRVYDVTAIDMDTQPPHWMHEYECDEMTKDWYISVPMSDHDYIVELGYQAIDGRWLVLVRSNHVRVPPIYPTDWENYQFINIPWDEDLRGKTFFRL